MKKEAIYTYLGVNGTISSPVLLEGIYSIKKIKLTADSGKILRKGDDERVSVTVPEQEVDLWQEIGQK
jgi:hypothetical protein